MAKLNQLLGSSDPGNALEENVQRTRHKPRKQTRSARLLAGRSAVLPGSRALIGALLCTFAALLTFGAYARANRPATTRYLVATRNLEPGAAVTSKDVEAIAMDLPETLRQRAFGSSVNLDGATVLGPVGNGELFQAGNLVKKAAGSQSLELSFPIDSAYAAAGRLRPGDRIDVLTNNGQIAVPVATDLLIIATSNPPDGVSSGRGTLVITVAYDGSFDGAALLGAAQNTKLSAIRRTGVQGNITAKVRRVPGSNPTLGSQTETQPPAAPSSRPSEV